MSDSMQPKETGKIWGYMREMKATMEGNHKTLMMLLVGPNGENGLNGLAKTNNKLIKILDERLDTHINSHTTDCIGSALLKEHEKKHNENIKEETAGRRYSDGLAVELRKSRIAMIGAIAVALITVAANIIF